MTNSYPIHGSHEFQRQDGRGAVRLTWEHAQDDTRLTATLDDGCVFKAQDTAFEFALERLMQVLPPGAAPKLCATCALAFLDFFSASEGFDDWSCFLARPDLAAHLNRRGKHADAHAFSYMHKVRVLATDVCVGYTARKTKGPL